MWGWLSLFAVTGTDAVIEAHCTGPREFVVTKVYVDNLAPWAARFLSRFYPGSTTFSQMITTC